MPGRTDTRGAGSVVVIGLLVAIITAAILGGGSSSPKHTASTPSGAAVARVASAGGLRLVEYPAAGFSGIESQIVRARSSIDMEIYELADSTIERDLVAAGARGVDVRVLLDRAYNGGAVNETAYAYLRSHKIAVRWAPSSYIFHIKATTFDQTTADISTANLVARYEATTRDAAIVDTEPRQVGAIVATFDDDWRAGPHGDPRAATVQAPGLVWSPDTGTGTARTALAAQIARARGSLDFESEELSDPVIIGALAAAARRGVDCRIVMTASSEWDAAFSRVRAAGCRVHVLPDTATGLYIHEKLILDDAGTAHASMFLGSQNASVDSLTRNRELGIIVGARDGGPAVMRSAAATFAGDFDDSRAWPAPATHHTHHGTSTPPAPGSCHPLSEEGHCYGPGEYGSDADRGLTGVAGDGDPIVCREDDGWRWEAVGG